MACNIALDAVKTVQFEENGRKEIDIKKYARVEKVNSPSVYFGIKLFPSITPLLLEPGRRVFTIWKTKILKKRVLKRYLK